MTYSLFWKLFVIHYSLQPEGDEKRRNAAMKESILLTKSKAFALRVVRLYKFLRDRKEFLPSGVYRPVSEENMI